MRVIGLLCVFLGVGLAAAYGSQLSPDYRARLIVFGDIPTMEAASSDAQQAYCEERKKAKLPETDGCGDADLLHGVKPELVAIDSGDDLSPRETAIRTIQLLKTVQEERPASVAQARGRWIISMEETLPFLNRKANIEEEMAVKEKVSPGSEPLGRLLGWFRTAYMGFFVGLALLIFGSILFRVDLRRSKSQGSDDSSTGARPEDFGVLLETLCSEARILSEEMLACKQPTEAQLLEAKSTLEGLQKKTERLVTAGDSLRNRYGLKGFADVFSPFSSGERLLNRTWATLADRHWPEAQNSIAAAVKSLESARASLQVLQAA